MASSCCPVCYKVGGSSASGTSGDFGGGGGHHDPVTAGAQQRFFELIQSFSENGKDGAAGGEGQQKFPFPLEQFEKFGMICCGECSKIMEGVCERHHQLETAQRSLNRKMGKLKRIMTEAQGSSTRLGEHLKVTGNEGAGDDDMMGAVLESKASLLAICSGKVTCSFSKLGMPRLEFHEEALSVLGPLPGNGGVGRSLDLSENLDLDLGEDGGSDLEEAHPVKRRKCESPRPPFGDGTVNGKRKVTNCTQSQDEEEAASTSTDTPRIIARERNNDSPPTSSEGHPETPLSETNLIRNANLDPHEKSMNVIGGLQNIDNRSSSPTPVVPKLEDVEVDLDEREVDDIDISPVFQAQTKIESEADELELEDDHDLDSNNLILQQPKYEARSAEVALVENDNSTRVVFVVDGEEYQVHVNENLTIHEAGSSSQVYIGDGLEGVGDADEDIVSQPSLTSQEEDHSNSAQAKMILEEEDKTETALLSESNIIGRAKLVPRDKSAMNVVGVEVDLDLDKSHDDGGSDDRREKETQLELEMSIKELYKEDPLQPGGDPKMLEVKKLELMSKLEEARKEDADLERMARRMAWRREVQREMKINAEFKKKKIMEKVPLEEVGVAEKPKMSRMSMEWREAFKKERTSFLFPQVLSTLLKQTVTRGPKPKILAYRLVSKASKESIDALLSSGHFFPQMWSGELVNVYYLHAPLFETMSISQFDNLEKAKAFTRKFCHQANPFFTRNIDISLEPLCSSPSTKYRQAIDEILRRWGKELWSAKLDLHFYENDSAESRYKLYNRLVTWLKLMPNLRVLGIQFGGVKPSAAVKATLTKHIAENPVPNMPRLERFVMNESSSFSSITHSLLSNLFSAMEPVATTGTLPDPNCAPRHPARVEGNISAIQDMHACYSDIESLEDVRKVFMNFNNWRLPLKRLELELRNDVEFSGLRILLLDNEALTCKGVYLEMPQLEELLLVLFYRIHLGTLDFLLPCKALKVLRLHTMRVQATGKGGRRRLQQPLEDNGIFHITDPADQDRVYQSPIWKLLPELRLIVLTIVPAQLDKVYFSFGESVTYHYTREEYLQQGMGE